MTRVDVEGPRVDVLDGELVVRFDYDEDRPEESPAVRELRRLNREDRENNGIRVNRATFSYTRGRFNFYVGKSVYMHDPNSSFGVPPGEEPPPRKELEEKFHGLHEVDQNWAHKADHTVVVL